MPENADLIGNFQWVTPAAKLSVRPRVRAFLSHNIHYSLLISPHSIAIPKGFYFTAVVFFFLFFRRPISEATERISTNQHIHLWLLFEKSWSALPRAFTSTSWGKNAFWKRLWTFTKHISATEHGIYNQKETCQSTGTQLDAPNSVNFGPETAENGWRVFAHPPKFSHWETPPALPHGRYITDNRHCGGRHHLHYWFHRRLFVCLSVCLFVNNWVFTKF